MRFSKRFSRVMAMMLTVMLVVGSFPAQNVLAAESDATEKTAVQEDEAQSEETDDGEDSAESADDDSDDVSDVDGADDEQDAEDPADSDDTSDDDADAGDTADNDSDDDSEIAADDDNDADNADDADQSDETETDDSVSDNDAEDSVSDDEAEAVSENEAEEVLEEKEPEAVGVNQTGKYSLDETTGILTFDDDVTEISYQAFKGNEKKDKIKKIDFPDGLQTIGKEAFYGCTNLTEVNFPDGLQTIGEEAFYGCTNLTGISLPSKLKTIGSHAFDGCGKIESIVLPENLETIGGLAFSDCGITSITVNSKNLTANSGYGVEWLDGNNSLYINYTFKNCPISEVIFGPKVTVVPGIFGGAKFKTDTLNINGAAITEIAAQAFYKSSGLKTVVFDGNNIKTISKAAFYGCEELEDIELPASLTKIDTFAFYGCTALGEVTLPENLSSIGGKAYAESGVTSVTVNSKNLTASHCNKYESVDYANPWVNYTFQNCQISELKFGPKVTTIPAIFGGARFTGAAANITINGTNSGITSISAQAFYKTAGLKKVTLTDSNIKTISEFAFVSCTDLESIELPAVITGIDKFAFYGCTDLSAVTLPEKLTKVGAMAFAESGIESVTVNSINLEAEASSYYEWIEGHGNIYLNKTFFNCQISELNFGPKVTIIPGIFGGALLTGDAATITIDGENSSITSIAPQAFMGPAKKDNTRITSLKKVVLTDSSIKKISELSFYGCEELEEVFLSASLTSVGYKAFGECTGLERVSFSGNTVTFAPEYSFKNISAAFAGCTSLETITLPEGVTALPEQLFYGCTSLKKVYLGSKISSIGQNAFNGIDENAYFYAASGSATYKSLKAYGIGDDHIISVCSLTYKFNGGATAADYPSAYSKADGTITLSDPAREDYKFCGWFTDARFTKSIGTHDEENNKTDIDAVALSGNATLYAKWDGPYYLVAFDAGDFGTITPAAEAGIEVKKGNTYGALPEVTLKPAYAGEKELLPGWYTADGELITSDTKVTDEAKNQVLYARYVNVKAAVAAPLIGIWGKDGNDDDECNIGDKVYVRCETDGAELSYSLEYSLDGNAFTVEIADEPYAGTFALSKAGYYKVTAKAMFIDASDTTEMVIHVVPDAIDEYKPAIYDADNAGAFWVSYIVDGTEQVYDPAAVSLPYTGAKVTLSGYKLYYGRTLLTEGTDYKVTYKNNTKPAAYNAGVKSAPTIVFTAKGNYTGTIEKTFSIYKAEDALQLAAKNVTVTFDVTEFVYNGKEQKPAVTSVVYKDPKTKEATDIPAADYTVTYSNNVNASKKAQVTVTFTGVNYCGAVSKNFTINQLDLKAALESAQVRIVADDEMSQYKTTNKNVSVIEEVQLMDGDDVLYALGKNDYTVSVKRVTNPDGSRTETYTLKGKGNYKGTATRAYEIGLQGLSDATVVPCKPAQLAKFGDAFVPGTVVAPIWANKAKNYLPAAYTVVDRYGDILAENKDFTVSYQVKQPGEASYETAINTVKYPAGTSVRMTITAKEKSIYTGSMAVVEYTIATAYDLAFTNGIAVTVNDVVYANKANNFNPKITVTDLRTNKALRVKTDYTVEYQYTEQTVVSGKNGKKTFTNVREAGDTVQATDIVPAGTTLKVVIRGKGNYASDTPIERTFRVGYNISTVTVKVVNVTYGENGVAVKPAESDITVTLKKEAVNPSCYNITEYTNNIKAGNASFILVGEGVYIGTKKVTYKIVSRSSKYTVTYDKGLGSLPKNNKEMATSQTALGANLTKITYIAPDCYEFAGWSFTPQPALPVSAEENAALMTEIAMPASKPTAAVALSLDTTVHPIGTAVKLYAWYKVKDDLTVPITDMDQFVKAYSKSSLKAYAKANGWTDMYGYGGKYDSYYGYLTKNKVVSIAFSEQSYPVTAQMGLWGNLAEEPDFYDFDYNKQYEIRTLMDVKRLIDDYETIISE